MRPSRITLAAITLAVASAGGIAYAATTGGSGTNSYGSSRISVANPPRQGNVAGSATLRVAVATVQGKSERILVDAHGLPLYTYAQDTATTSRVSGQLAALWPPLIDAKPTEQGTTAPIGVRATGNGQQVTYRGHFLYTFVEDQPGRVTGQGVQDFFVATPDAGPSSGTTASPAPAAPGSEY